jgi:hypothetical protein
MRTETDRILLRAASSGASLDDLAAIIRGNLTPECAAAVRAVTEALGKKAGPEDDRTETKRFHDALQLACVLYGESWRFTGRAPLEACRLSEGCVSIGFMNHLSVSGEHPVVPLPEREPAAIRAAVARLDPGALARFEADWTAATARARDEYSLLPARYFVEHWFTWVAVARWPELAARLRACERVVAESPDRAERRQAAIEISQILRQAETITA